MISRTGIEATESFFIDKESYVLDTYLPKKFGDNGWLSTDHFYDVLITPRGSFTMSKLTTLNNLLVEVGQFDYNYYNYLVNVRIKMDTILRNTKDFRGMGVGQRGCLFKDELDLEFFPEYSNANCVLECSWRLAKDTCGCVPWFLRSNNSFPGSKLCEVMGNRCFKSLVDGRYREQPQKGICMERCLDDCEVTEFRLDAEVKKMSKMSGSVCSRRIGKDLVFEEGERDELCQYYEDMEKFTTMGLEELLPNRYAHVAISLKNLYMHKQHFPLNFYRTVTFDVNNALSFVHVYVDGKTVTEIVMSPAATLMDKVSNIGGTLGLFSGFSILSGIEIIYWIVIAIMSKKKSKAEKAKRMKRTRNRRAKQIKNGASTGFAFASALM